MYGVPDFYQNDNVKKGTGMQWRHQVVSDLPTSGSALAIIWEYSIHHFISKKFSSDTDSHTHTVNATDRLAQDYQDMVI